MDSSAFRKLAVDDRGDRLDLAIARPEQRNALDFETWDELDAAMATVERRDDLRVVTLTGQGEAFCAGVDFDSIRKSLGVEREQYPSFIRRWAGVADRFERVAQPTLAAINGPAVGAGFELALACDLRIASEQAVFCMPQMRMGIVPDAGGTSRLGRATGSAFAKDLILSGRVVDAQEALRTGIVSRVVPHDSLAAEIDELAATIAALPWPSGYLASVAVDVCRELDSRQATDLAGIADQVMLREEAVWQQIEAFLAAKGIKGSSS